MGSQQNPSILDLRPTYHARRLGLGILRRPDGTVHVSVRAVRQGAAEAVVELLLYGIGHPARVPDGVFGGGYLVGLV